MIRILIMVTFGIGVFSIVGGLSILFDFLGYELKEITGPIGFTLLGLGLLVCFLTTRALKLEK